MKQASVVVISVFLSSAVFCIAERPARAEQPIPTSKPDVKPVVTFHLLGDEKLTGAEAFKLPLKKLTLNEEPLLSGQDVLFYDRRNCQLFLAFSTLKRMVKAIGYKRRARSSRFVPLIVTVRGEKRFLCALSRAEPSLSRFRPPPIRPPKPDIERDMAGVGAVTLLSPWGGPDGKDPRDDAVFLKALGEAKKLDESTLAQPRMSRDKVIDAARKMNINWRHPKRRPLHVPDSWKIASVTFCREAVFTQPSINIIGLVGPFSAYCVWIVRFDASADPESKKAHWRRIACLVDDATGNVHTIHPPLYVKALPVREADIIAAQPVASERQVRKAARRVLKEIASAKFFESVEVLPLTEKQNLQVWRPMRRVWVCKGTDAAGNQRRVIVMDRIPYYCMLKGIRFKLRRPVAVRQPSSGSPRTRPLTEGTKRR